MKKHISFAILAVLSVGSAFAQSRLATGPNSGVPATAPAPFLPNAVITQGFDSLPAALTAGWVTKNQTLPNNAAIAGWVQGDGIQITPAGGQAGGASSFAQFTFDAGTGTADSNNWLISPQVNYGNGAVLEFWTVKRAAPFADRIEVRFSTAGASSNTGTSSTDVGDFTNLAFTVNPGLVTTAFTCPAGGVVTTANATSNIVGYPTAAWCLVRITGFPTTGSGRIAFRHSTTNGGPDGANGTIGGVDTVSFDEGTQGSAMVTPVTAAGAVNLGTTTSGVSRPLVFNNTGTLPGSVTCTLAAGATNLTISPTTAVNVPAGGSGTVTLVAAGAPGATVSGTVDCQIAGGALITYTVAGTISAVTAINTLSTFGFMAMGLMLLGFGVLAARRFS